MKFSRIVASLAIAAAFSASAYAAPPSEQCPPRGMARHQEKLHEKLQLTPAQEAAWAKFSATLQEAPCRMKESLASAGEKLTAPEHMDRMVKVSEDMQAKLVKHAAAVKEFYGTLSAQQKAVMDEFHQKLARKMKGAHDTHGAAPHGSGMHPAAHAHHALHERHDMPGRLREKERDN